MSLKKIEEELENLKKKLGIEALYNKLMALRQQLSEEWKDDNKELINDSNEIEENLELFLELEKELKDLMELELLDEKGELKSIIDEFIAAFPSKKKSLIEFYLFNPEKDLIGCFLELHSNAGGTDACDWCQMLMRMYIRWIEEKNYDYDIIYVNPSKEEGIKGALIKINSGEAYKKLEKEMGLHRLVRISPFNANKKRMTSFASVIVHKILDTKEEIIINPSDLRIDTFKASGAGGQHVNKTESAIRITHIPTGLVSECQEDRSQQKNRTIAMRRLMDQLYFKQQQEKKQEKASLMEKQFEHVRSYVLDPYKIIKDLRSNWETKKVEEVLNGDLDDLILSLKISK